MSQQPESAKLPLRLPRWPLRARMTVPLVASLPQGHT
jgi:hypothetical protein